MMILGLIKRDLYCVTKLRKSLRCYVTPGSDAGYRACASNERYDSAT